MIQLFPFSIGRLPKKKWFGTLLHRNLGTTRESPNTTFAWHCVGFCSHQSDVMFVENFPKHVDWYQKAWPKQALKGVPAFLPSLLLGFFKKRGAIKIRSHESWIMKPSMSFPSPWICSWWFLLCTLVNHHLSPPFGRVSLTFSKQWRVANPTYWTWSYLAVADGWASWLSLRH